MKNGRQIQWNAIPICETFKISCLMGRLHTKGALEKNCKGPIIPFGSLVEYYPYFCGRISQESINLERKSCLDCSSDTLCTRGRIWKGDVLVSDIEELETMDASEIYSKRLNAKEVIFPKESGKFIFQSQMDESNFAGGDQELRTSTLIREHPFQGEGHVDFLGESEGSSTTSRLTSGCR